MRKRKYTMKLKNLSDFYHHWWYLKTDSTGITLAEHKEGDTRRAHQTAKRIGISHNTAYTFMTDRAADKKHLDLDTFAIIMIDGLEISKEAFLEFKISDLFTIE